VEHEGSGLLFLSSASKAVACAAIQQEMQEAHAEMNSASG